MPDTYTKEQIDEAKLWLTTNDTGDSYDQKRRIGFEAIVLSALDTAERERDVLLEAAKLDLAEKRIVTEQLIAERDALASRCAELEARLQGAAGIRERRMNSVSV